MRELGIRAGVNAETMARMNSYNDTGKLIKSEVGAKVGWLKIGGVWYNHFRKLSVFAKSKHTYIQ